MVITSKTEFTTALYRILACSSKKLQRIIATSYYLTNISVRNLSDECFTTCCCQGMH